MTTVVGIGSCGIDYFAIVPRLLGPEEKTNAERIEIHAGGVTGNNLTQVARLGAKAGWLGLIGDDENGRLITRAFAEDGLDLSGIEVIPGEKIHAHLDSRRCSWRAVHLHVPECKRQAQRRAGPLAFRRTYYEGQAFSH